MRSPCPAKNAAAIVLLKPEADRFQVFLTRPSPGTNFLAGTQVFPGGGVRSDDWAEGLLKRCYGLQRQEARRILGMRLGAELALGHWVAGIRELFEELGVLLCVTENGEALDMEERAQRERFAMKRKALIAGSINFQRFLESEGLFCDAARLAYFSNWRTSQQSGIHLDTRFYLCRLPAYQSPLPSSHKASQGIWIDVERALKLNQEGRLPLTFPTFASLRSLADFDCLESLSREFRLG